MKNGKTIFLMVCAVMIIGAILIGEINFQSIATDSGFDTGYSGGGGTSGGGSSGGGSSGHSRAPLTPTDIFESFLIIIVAETIIMIVTIINRAKRKEKFKRKSHKIIFIFLATILISLSLIILVTLAMISIEALLTLLFSSLILFLWIFITYEMVIKITKFYKNAKNLDSNIMERKKKEALPPTEENKKMLAQGYQIYLDVQKAWMNFDYENMKLLVTDEMFNMYYNQLQTLELKGQQNIMKDFKFYDSLLISDEVENNIHTISMILNVSFYDYIIDNEKKIVRGTNRQKVKMIYLLTFVYSEDRLTKCPNCGASVEKQSVCPYCNTMLHGVSEELKLAKKEVLYQGVEKGNLY